MEHIKIRYNKTAFLLTILLSLLALGSLLWIWVASTDRSSSQQLMADIYQNGELLRSIPLHSVEETYTFTVTGTDGCRNEIQVCPGSIGMISADCPDKLCVKQGFIRSSILPITCLPNHLVIQIRTEDNIKDTEDAVDITTY